MLKFPQDSRRKWRFLAGALALACIGSATGEVCVASQYGVGDGYHGCRTASGAIFNTYARNPYTIARPSRADLGRAGAEALGMGGLGWVRVERLE